jgi:NAD(P)-dependent dehydrogenase (short-subunit alcohol dehydrogenase family)
MILQDKVIIVTGGSGLIGKEIIRDITSEGGIAVNCDINVHNDLEFNYTFKMDITCDDSIVNAIESIINKFLKIDGLVNCAYPRTNDRRAKFDEMNLNSWRKNIDMQLNSYVVSSQKVIQKMINQGFGSIINLGSIYGVVGNDFTLYEEYGGTSSPAYSAAKGGIISLTRFLASYYGPLGIRINCVSPGGIKDINNQHPSFIKKYEFKVPMRRLGEPKDISPVISFLLSDKSKYITGQNIIVDGGWTSI